VTKPFEEKVRVAQMWIDMTTGADTHNNRPSIRTLASAAKVSRAVEYAELIDMLPTLHIKFADEKHLKGHELFNRYGRRCPITGELEPVIVDPDFGNSHTIIGCCGIAPDAPPFYFWMHDGTNDAFIFSEFVYSMVVDGFLRSGDVLVIDNASIHRYRESAVLEEILWEDYKILLIFMPAQSPELNPIELLWHILVQRLRRVPLAGRHTSERNALAAKDIMDTFTHSEVESCYQKCNYIL
jgi:hypothetical protein